MASRFEVSDLQRQCGELRGELVQAQAEMSMDAQPLASAVHLQAHPQRTRAGGAGVAWQAQGPGGTVRWHDANAVFESFASPGPQGMQMYPADFGHLCEKLRRAQGRGPSAEKERREFAQFAFTAVFGNEAAAERSMFLRLYPHFALMLQELEETFASPDD